MGALMSVLRSMVMSFSLFSKIPMPQVRWEENSMRYLMCFFPLVGAVEGALLCLWAQMAHALGLTAPLVAAGLLALPVIVTGGIHLDGYCDVHDALSSHAEAERKREILKDPHVGAFAVIGVVTYLLVYFGLACDLAQVGLTSGLTVSMAVPIVLVPVISRCLSGLSTLSFPKSSSKGMLSMEGSSDSKGRAIGVLVVVLLVSIALLLWFNALAGVFMAFSALLTFMALWRLSFEQFGGMSGDLAGWFLQVAELLMLGCLVLSAHLSQMGVTLW
ncbi:adenosylcobinamide-GDP ribazoletransferase [Paratractidigestivibacter sp.]|uniref:adenosylcobinamide-GDP ribazoletransferase n=1 Tax=Paratractidigestivibacter sp. TaxID=2847316 RepID=UPI002ABE59DE|nr:adenosylcobinamide-GDP ribazoletransferase [Paratractidigestivibacter sp.]